MGIEKLIPRAADLPVFLRLLARSATGQALTAYTSHFHGPRAGRRAAHRDRRQRPQRAARAPADFARRARLHPLRRLHEHLSGLPAQRRPQLRRGDPRVRSARCSSRRATRRAHASLPYACTLCGSCRDVCPVSIDLPQQLLAWRGELLAQRAARGARAAPRCARRASRSSGRALYAALGALARCAARALPERWLAGRWNAVDARARAARAAARRASARSARGDGDERARRDPRARSAAAPAARAVAAAALRAAPRPRRRDLFARFAASLAAAGGTRARCASADALADALRTDRDARGARARLVVAARDRVAPPDGPPRAPHDLAELDVALLRGELAVAENGAVWWAPRDPLERAAALPRRARRRWSCRARRSSPTCTTPTRASTSAAARFGCFVCGPSKTADIEQALVIGAHGPRSLLVLVVGSGG